MSFNHNARTWNVGDVPTAAMLNSDLRDLSDGIQDPWDTYDVDWTALTTNPRIGNGSISGRYLRIGQTVDVLIHVVWGSTTSSGQGQFRLSLPIDPKNNIGSRLNVAGHVTLVSSVDYFQGVTDPLGGKSTGTMYAPNKDNPGDLDPLGGYWGGSSDPWRNGDMLTVWGRYEAA